MADSGEVREYYSLMRKRTLAILDYILGKASPGDIEKVEDEIFVLSEPRVFSGKNGAEVRFIKMFEETCVLLSQHTPKDPKRMSVVEFYSALEIIKRQLKTAGRKPAKTKPNGKPNQGL